MISNALQIILYLGSTVKGAVHDYTMFKEEFPNDEDNKWFELFKLWVDSGYQGIGSDYQIKELHIPFKKPRKTDKNPNPELTQEQKEHNKTVSKGRIYVENAIAGMKRFGILTQKLRNKSHKFADDIAICAAGLWNFSKGFSFN